MNEIEDLLTCPICKQTFNGCLIILSCCESNVCQHHIEEKNNETSNKPKLFTCVLCEKTHELENSKKFAPNRIIEKLLAKDIFKRLQMPEKINLGDIFLKTENEIKYLQVSFLEINDLIKDPKNYIFDKISNIKGDVDLRRVELIEKIDEISDEMIDKLNKYQQECYDNIEKIKLEEKTKDMVKVIESGLEEWTNDNKRILLISDDSKRIEIRSKAIELDTKLYKRLKELKAELMMNREWIYLENGNFNLNQYEKELIQFDGIKHSIEFELKDFNSIYNQNKQSFESAKYKYGAYDWSLSACVENEKKSNQENEELWFSIYLLCESVNKIKFPLLANMKYSVLNKDKDSRNDFYQSTSYCYEENTAWGKLMLTAKDLMNVEKGYYDSANDKVTIKAEFQFQK